MAARVDTRAAVELSGLPATEEDVSVFSELQEVGKILKLPVLDSLIFNKREFYSLKDLKL